MSHTPRVVIVGGGFGGLSAARVLGRSREPIEITLIDRSNHHTFQPLLYQVATSSLSGSDITAPIRWLLRQQKDTIVLLAEVRAIDAERRVVITGPERHELLYDFLILATGSRHSYFGHDEWAPLAPGLKGVEDAIEIRRRFLLAFEKAEQEEDPAIQDEHLTFVIVGGGPTGVELAGVMPEIARRALRDDFRRIDTQRTRVILLEGGDRVVPGFPPPLSERARRDLEHLGVEVRTKSLVTRIESDAVYVRTANGEERIPTRTVFWAAGNAASPLARSLGVPLDRAGRVYVERDLSVPGHPEIFVIGDLAYLEQDGKPVPALAAAANQEGTAAARNILRSIRGEPRQEFCYRDKGVMAVIGRYKAIADFGKFSITGRIAWFLWLFVHILYLVGFRNRLSVLLSWAYAYFTYQRGVRLILDVSSPEPTPSVPLPVPIPAATPEGLPSSWGRQPEAAPRGP